MQIINCFAVLLLTLCALAEKDEEDVLEFDDSDFDSRITEHDTALVMFYAPWCGHCKRLKPHFAEAAEELSDNNPPVALVKVDCTQSGKQTCKKFGVSGYPTLKIFQNGEFSQDYKGPRDTDGIVDYLMAQAGLASEELKTVADLDKFLSSAKDPVFVGFFEKESNLKSIYLKLTNKFREKAKFAHTSSKELVVKHGDTDVVILFRPAHLRNKFESDSIKYSGHAESTELYNFAIKHFHGLVGIRRDDNQEDFQKPLIVVYVNIDYDHNPKGTHYWRNRVLKVAKGFERKLNFAISDRDELKYELKEFGIESTPTEKPRVTARDLNDKKYILEDEFSVDALQAFASNLLAGKLKPHVKSEPIPETQQRSVSVAVAKNFDDVVTNNGKDTLIKFYAPWCGHCKHLAPVYEEMAEMLKDEDVAIVKMDATANDVPSKYQVDGFPTLYWVRKDKKDEPVKYEGGREVDDFIKFIAREATAELKGWDRSGQLKAVKNEL